MTTLIIRPNFNDYKQSLADYDKAVAWTNFVYGALDLQHCELRRYHTRMSKAGRIADYSNLYLTSYRKVSGYTNGNVIRG
jgi:hypothetical protein